MTINDTTTDVTTATEPEYLADGTLVTPEVQAEAEAFVRGWLEEHPDATELLAPAIADVEAGEHTWVELAGLIQEAEMRAFLKFLAGLTDVNGNPGVIAE